MIRCRVLGPVEVEVNGAAAPPELLWRKHLALLIYLARSPRLTRTREHLTGMLWPDKGESAARHSLNEALRILRRTAGDHAIEAEADKITLSPGVVALDSDELEHHLSTGAFDLAAALVAGDFLEGFSLPGTETFEDWLGAERRAIRASSLGALVGWSERLLREGRAGQALQVAERAAALDPYSDVAIRAVMGALAVQGETARARAAFESFAATLARELGVEPARETRVLAGRIGTVRAPRAPLRRAEEPELRRAPLVGRKAELGALLECRAGYAGKAVALIIEGEGGTGKSRLLAELGARLTLEGVAPVLVRAVEADRTQEDSGLTGIARGGLLDAPGVSAADPRALGALAVRFPEWGDRFRNPIASDQPLATALAAVVEAACDAGPLALLVDDAHWLDRTSLLAFSAMLRNLGKAPLIVGLTLLPEPVREEIDLLRGSLGRDLPGTTVVLRPLDGPALRELTTWAFPRYQPVAIERLARRIGGDSAGLPFLAVELLSAVAAGLELRETGAAWPTPLRTLTETMPADLPDTITAALRLGFRRLSSEAQQVLVAAAVVGTRVTEPLLARVTELPAGSLAPALDELEWQRWLASDGTGYSFVARIAARVIERDMVTRGQRTRILERLSSASPG